MSLAPKPIKHTAIFVQAAARGGGDSGHQEGRPGQGQGPCGGARARRAHGSRGVRLRHEVSHILMSSEDTRLKGLSGTRKWVGMTCVMSTHSKSFGGA